VSRIRTYAAQKLGDAIAAIVRFPEKPTVVAAPPSMRTVYPALAVLIDSSEWAISTDEWVEVDPNLQPGDPGYLLAGFYRTDAEDNYVHGDLFKAETGQYLSHIGTMRCKGRLWIASRSAAQREQLEDDVALVFFRDDAAPGRLLVDISGVTVGGVVIPFGTAAAEIDTSTWSAEFAYDERLWSFLPFQLDAPLMIPRDYPTSDTIVLAVTEDLSTPVDSVADLSQLQNALELTVDGDGNTDPFTP
jgi:hypothetical protein